MSFQNYEGFQNPQGQPDVSGAAAGAPPQQDTPMGGQMQDNAGQFQGGNSGDPGSAGGQQPGGDAKTTLWYDPILPCTSDKSGVALCSHIGFSLVDLCVASLL